MPLFIAGAGGYSGITIGNALTNLLIKPSSNDFVFTGGNVGIGTTSPVGDLSLYGGQQNIVLTNTAADGVAGLTISRIIGQARGYSNNLSVMQSIDFETNSGFWYKGDIVFKTNNTDGTDTTVAASERMRIKADGSINIGSRRAALPSNFGYSGSYKVLILGSSGANYQTDAVTLSLGVDVTGNPSGSFTGNGREIIIRNEGSFISPNAANNGYNSILSWNSSGQPYFSQNVGIGVTGTDSRLTVSSGTANNVANFKSTDGTAYIAISDNSSSSALGNQVGVVGDQMYFAVGDVERMRLVPDGDSTFLILKAKPSTYNSKSFITLYGTNSSTYGGSVIARSSISSETNGGPYGANLKFTTNDNNNVEQTRMTMFGATGAVQLNSYNSTNNTGTPTYLLGTDASGNVVKTLPYVPPTGTTQFFNQSSSYNNSTPGVTGYGNVSMDTSVSYYDTGKNVGVETRGIVWTGKHYIVTDYQADTAKFYDNNFDLITNPEASTITLPSVGGAIDNPHGGAWDGRYLYCINYTPATFAVYDLDNGTTTATLVNTQALNASGATFDVEYAEGHLYTCTDGKVSKYKVEGKTITHVFTSGNILNGIEAQAITYDGSYLWFTQNGNSAFKVSLDCVLVATITTGLPVNNVAWAWNGQNIASVNYQTGDIYIVNTAETRFDTEQFLVMGGNVGIGTASPDAKLEVEKTVNGSFYSVFAKNPSGGSSAFVSKKWLNDDAAFGEIWRNSSTRSSAGQGALSFNMYNSADINFWSGGTHTMALVQNSVGIGTTSPGYKLNVINDNTATWTARFTNNTNNVYLSVNDANNYGIYVSGETKNYFSGNVGIGTTSPSYKLDVNGIIRSENSSEVGTLYLGNTAQSQIPGGAIIGQRSPNYSSTGNLLFQVPTWGANTDYGLTTQMSIEVSGADTKEATISMIPFGGKVGIGTTSPNYLLDLSKTAVAVDTYSGINLQASNYGYTIEGGLTQNVGGELIFSSNNAGTRNPRVKFAANGNVGIGTSTPLAKLDIQGAQGQLFSVTDNLSGSIFAASDISGVPILDVNSNGKVGINTTSANDIFDVRSPSWAARIQSTVDGTYLRMSPNQIATFNSAGAGSPLYLNHSSSGNIIMAGGGGVVLVGATSTPFNYGGSILHIGGARATLGLKSSGSLATIALSSGNVSDKDIHINHDGLTGGLNFYQYSVTPISARVSMFLAGNGYLGLGTSSPDEKLTVNGITRAVDPIYFGAINTDNGTYGPYIESYDDKGLKFDYNGNNGGEFQVWNHDQNGGGALQVFNIDQDGNVGINITSGSDKLTLKGAFSLYDTSAISTVIRLNPNGDSYINGGDLGVGITLPQHKLDVGGTIRSYNYRLAGNTTNPTTTAATIYDQSGVGLTLSAHNVELRNYNGSSMVRSVFFTHNTATFTGTCTATNFILSSDETLKDNIKNIDNKHIDVDWKNFELKSEPGVKRSGVIAQELEKKHPEFVRTDEEGLKSVAYIDLLIAKIAELEARLEKAGI